MTFAPIAFKKSVCLINSFSVSSYGLEIKKLENQQLQICIPLKSNAFFSVSTSVGYFPPTSDPVNPANAISLTHC